jgi:ribosomal peptide maturation radical SAM protein 1
LSSHIYSKDNLIIIPPFASLFRPSIGVHILQSCAQKNGFKVGILYANIIFGADIGINTYEKICGDMNGTLVGEQIFTLSAYGTSPFEKDFDDFASSNACKSENISNYSGIGMHEIRSLELKALKWTDTIARAVVKKCFKIVGCTTTFQQTASSIALLKRIKFYDPDVITIIGGANCQGIMAEGIRSLSNAVDYVFSGESEVSFVEFLKDIKEKRSSASSILYGAPCSNLDDIPIPDFTDFYEQIRAWIPNCSLIGNRNIWLPYESSRGCWWGQKHQCTFCGINSETIKFRQKSPERVMFELKELLKKHPNKNICMVDNIMPRSYFKTLLPYLSIELPGINIFYEQKANLSLDDVIALKKAGIAVIQPGIESLSTRCLKLVNKGISARQNIALLRYARSVGLALNWNLLYAIPHDKIVDYKTVLEILPFLHHLHPPASLSAVSIIRFSPYFENPNKYEISNIYPIALNGATFPENGTKEKASYFFTANYKSESMDQPEIMKKFKKEIESWYDSWATKEIPPILSVTDIGDDRYLLLDTRELYGTKKIQFIEHNQALLILAGKTNNPKEDIKWALENKLIVELDSKYVPLATALPNILGEFESEFKSYMNHENAKTTALL